MGLFEEKQKKHLKTDEKLRADQSPEGRCRSWMASHRSYTATTFGIRGFGRWPATEPHPRSQRNQRAAEFRS
jgi:hypothetical protein